MARRQPLTGILADVPREGRKRVIAYIALVVVFALAAHYGAPKAGGGASAFVVMWTPALAEESQ